jgi:hypothetical protein
VDTSALQDKSKINKNHFLDKKNFLLFYIKISIHPGNRVSKNHQNKACKMKEKTGNEKKGTLKDNIYMNPNKRRK